MRGNYYSLYVLLPNISRNWAGNWLATHYLIIPSRLASYFSHLWYANRFYRKPKNGTRLKNVSITDRPRYGFSFLLLLLKYRQA